MDQFVCVRITRTTGMDLSLFQFNWWSTWTVFLMNSDRAIYGRFGGKAENQMAGLKKALEGGLELHKSYPANKAGLEGKKGLPIEWKTPEDVPIIKERKALADGRRRIDCVHCHHLWEAVMTSLIDADLTIPERYRVDYPSPDRIGIVLDPEEKAAVTRVKAESSAAIAGIEVGDRITRLAGQPILSIADVEWILYAAEDVATLPVELERAGRKEETSIKLTRGWRSR